MHPQDILNALEKSKEPFAAPAIALIRELMEETGNIYVITLEDAEPFTEHDDLWAIQRASPEDYCYMGRLMGKKLNIIEYDSVRIGDKFYDNELQTTYEVAYFAEVSVSASNPRAILKDRNTHAPIDWLKGFKKA